MNIESTIENCESLSSFADRIKEEAKNHLDITCPLEAMEPTVVEDENGYGVAFYHEGMHFRPTDHVLKQLGMKIGTSNYLSTLRENTFTPKGKPKIVRDEQDAQTMRSVIANGMRRFPNKKDHFFRCTKDGSMRAFLTNRYSTLDHGWFIAQIQQIIPEGKVFRGEVGDSINVKIIVPDSVIDQDDSDYGSMITGRNNEVGGGGYATLPSVFRGLCSNGMIFGEKVKEGMRGRHIGELNLNEIRISLREKLIDGLKLIPQKVEDFVSTKQLSLTAPSKKAIAQIVQDNKFSRKTASRLISAYDKEPSSSLFGLINSVTRAAQEMSTEEGFNMERLGGNMMRTSESQWNNFNVRANALDDGRLEQLLGA